MEQPENKSDTAADTAEDLPIGKLQRTVQKIKQDIKDKQAKGLLKPKTVNINMERTKKESQFRKARLAKPSDEKLDWIHELPAEIRRTPIADYQINTRLKYILIRSGIVLLEDLAKESELSISERRCFGARTLAELRAWMEKLRMSSNPRA